MSCLSVTAHVLSTDPLCAILPNGQVGMILPALRGNDAGSRRPVTRNGDLNVRQKQTVEDSCSMLWLKHHVWLTSL